MEYGICNLSLAPLRAEPRDASEMVSQVLFGEHFKILEKHEKWSQIQLATDNYIGWIDNKQFVIILENEYQSIQLNNLSFTANIIDFITDQNSRLSNVLIGAHLPNFKNRTVNIGNEYLTYEGEIKSGKYAKENIIKTALLFLNTPYLWGGKSPFGIDCSGFTQLVYKLNGYFIKRDAKDQAKEGNPLSFIEESEPGDLAFFDNEEGNIIHVGIIMNDNYIIHAHGKVRIDRLDHLGIFNVDTKKHSHRLRVMKKII